jgi:hypothetical protein
MKRLLILTALATVFSTSSGCMSSNSCSSGGGFHPFYHWFHRGDACDAHQGMSGGCGCNSGQVMNGMPTSSYIPSAATPMYSQPLPGPGVREILPQG